MDLEQQLDQDRRMRAVLIAMQCLSYGATMRIGQSTSSGKPSGGECPPGESRPLHTVWQQTYVLAPPEGREDVIAAAADALVEARVRTVPVPQGETPEQWEDRLIKEGEDWPARAVAVQFNTGVRIVTKLRIKHERHPHDGRRLEKVSPVSELVERGLSARQIAAITGKSASGAQYYVNKVKKAA